jgi:hypothetical protein
MATVNKTPADSPSFPPSSPYVQQLRLSDMRHDVAVSV